MHDFSQKSTHTPHTHTPASHFKTHTNVHTTHIQHKHTQRQRPTLTFHTNFFLSTFTVLCVCFCGSPIELGAYVCALACYYIPHNTLDTTIYNTAQRERTAEAFSCCKIRPKTQYSCVYMWSCCAQIAFRTSCGEISIGGNIQKFFKFKHGSDS